MTNAWAFFVWNRDETFLRLLVGKLKRMDPSEKGRPPWRDAERRCRLYHEHADEAVCGGGECRTCLR